MKGNILGFCEITSYISCQKHWNKLDKDNVCPKCEGIAQNIKLDFHTEMYVQDSNSDNIKTFLLFKRQIEKIADKNDTGILKKELDELEGKECIVKFNSTEEEKQIIPVRVKLTL